jgi:cell division protein FtsL
VIKILNFFCVALAGLSILALYHISERTRVTNMELTAIGHAIADERSQTSVLQAEWERVAGPARIQMLAERELGMTDTASVQLSAFDQLPRRGADAPLGNTPLHAASAQMPADAPADAPPAAAPDASIQQVTAHSGL